MTVQNTCPAPWVNSSMVPSQSPFMANPISVLVERMAAAAASVAKVGSAEELATTIARNAGTFVGNRAPIWILLLVVKEIVTRARIPLVSTVSV